MLLAFFVPSIQDPRDRFRARRVVERYVGAGRGLIAEKQYGVAERAFTKALESAKSMMKALQEHTWPGNVRELEHAIETAVIASPEPILRLGDGLERESAEAREEPIKGLETIEREHILKVLQTSRWKVEGEGGAASILGLHPNTLRSRIKKLGIKRPNRAYDGISWIYEISWLFLPWSSF